MPALRKSWVQTANFWNKPRIGSFIQKISSRSNDCWYLFKNNLRPFEKLMSSVRKQSSPVWTAEVISVWKKKKSAFVWMAEVIYSRKCHPFKWLRFSDPPHLAADRAFYKHLFTTIIPFLWLFECLESCYKCFFSSSDAWRNPFEIVC